MDKSVERYVRILVRLLALTGLSHAEIAMGAGLGDGTVSQIAKNESAPISLTTVRKIEAFAAEVTGEWP